MTPTFQTLHIEICTKKPIAMEERYEYVPLIEKYLMCLSMMNNNCHIDTNTAKDNEAYPPDFIDKIYLSVDGLNDDEVIHFGCNASLSQTDWHWYMLKKAEPMIFDLSTGENDPTGQVTGSQQWELPNAQFDDLWQILVYDDSIKSDLLNYAYALLKISEKGANVSVLSLNRLILLYGSPGTGKTSLCKAISQKLAIRLKSRYKRAIFVEVNSHSLFSKWFSESGKLIQKMFDQVRDLLDDSNLLVFILIDEVESLTMARQSGLNRNEPADAVRAVNALLTQIDAIRNHGNVLVFSTSNLTQAVDEAFVDRADIKRLVPRPSKRAALTIYNSCIDELQKIGILEKGRMSGDANSKLTNIANLSVGLSGRSLRKLPILAYAQRPTETCMKMDTFLEHLAEVVTEKNSTEQQIKVTTNGYTT